MGALVALFSCSATRYVPQGMSLLRDNELDVEDHQHDLSKSEKKALAEDVLASYIQQRPNRRFLGAGLQLGFYNMVDTAKHSIWHRFWANSVGAPPVIYDSTTTEISKEQLQLYLSSNGFFRGTVSDSVSTNDKRKTTVHYTIKSGKPYTVGKVSYRVGDKFLEQVLYEDTLGCLIRTGERFQTSILDKERSRIAENLQNQGYWGFGVSYISFAADSTAGDGVVDVDIRIRRFVEGIDADGDPILTNHPIYRISDITLNSYYDPTVNLDYAQSRFDTLTERGIDILYHRKPYIRERVLVNAVRLSPNEFYDASSVSRTRENLRNLGYSANVIFTELPQGEDQQNMITLTDSSGEELSTTERLLGCVIQCTPNLRQNFNTELELSTTANYFSGALSFGYQNLNLFRGGEIFSADVRGAYELMKSGSTKNAFELGFTMSLEAPRFWLPISEDKQSLYRGAASKVTLSYSSQERPDYHRDLMSAVFGYSWTMANGARFTINPLDFNLVSVPWVSDSFLETIENPYLRNSYQSQMIAGLSTSYYYTNNANLNENGFVLRVNADVNGNLFSGLGHLFGNKTQQSGEEFYKIFGLRFSQYARASVSLSGRANLADETQLGWRFLLAGGYAYGNSNTIPFDRLYFAGGASSMRGWQVRTLGPGSVYIDNLGSYPNQQGDLHLEANIELRQKLIYGLSGAMFFDLGNIWMNSDGETRDNARFNFNTFYKELAFNTGLGLRYDIAGMMILRFDWGLKLHNPNNMQGQRWFKNLGFADTAFHFAIGLPF